MSIAATEQSQPLIPADRKAIVAAHPAIANSARWFWWIAGLSLVNSVMIHSGSERTFLAGLGFTLMADALFHTFKPAAFLFDALGIGFFVVIGLMALRGYRWAFMVGGIFYALDAVIYLCLQAFLPLAFHGWALFSIWTGGMALNRAIKEYQSTPRQPTPPLLPTTTTAPSSLEPPPL